MSAFCGSNTWLQLYERNMRGMLLVNYRTHLPVLLRTVLRLYVIGLLIVIIMLYGFGPVICRQYIVTIYE